MISPHFIVHTIFLHAKGIQSKGKHQKTQSGHPLSAAFPHTIPILAGFLFLGMTYGIYMRTLGAICGSLLHFNTEGLDFVMTAMFVVIFMEQWMKEKCKSF